jgi:hypothetical protein
MATEKAAAAEEVERIALSAQLVDDKTASHLKEELQSSKQGGFIPETPEEKKVNRALNRKFDLFILPFCVIIYMFNGT